MLLLVLLATAAASALQENDTCTTPNHESAKCIPVAQCGPINQALSSLEEQSVKFARASQCGFQNGPLVCCGETARYRVQPSTAQPPTSTAKPPTSTAKEPSSAREPLPLDSQLLPDSSLCGLQVKDNRIYGGKVTEINEFPWMAALKYTKNDGSPGGVRCGGTLINHRYVLTAAQCLAIPGHRLTSVSLGEWKLSTSEDCVKDTEDTKTCADPVLELPIVEITPHPYYNKRSGNNDIALLMVNEKINFTEFVRPICMPPDDHPPPQPGSRMHISGWGLTEKGTQSDVKLKLEIPMVSNQDCAEAYPNFLRLNPNQACAGGERGRDACNGDSGGPLMRTYQRTDQFEEEQWFQEGIIYRGLGCGHEGIPGLYTRVSRYIHWILNNLKHP